jgi:hypothetical protein
MIDILQSSYCTDDEGWEGDSGGTRECAAAEKRPPGLKPTFSANPDAALKRRSSTVMRVAERLFCRGGCSVPRRCDASLRLAGRTNASVPTQTRTDECVRRHTNLRGASIGEGRMPSRQPAGCRRYTGCGPRISRTLRERLWRVKGFCRKVFGASEAPGVAKASCA